MPPVPKRLLFVHPDAYGDLVIFEPVLRLVRHFWPGAEIAVLIRKAYQDIAPLLGASGAHWLTTDCNPYREAPSANPAALAALHETVRAFAPDCLVAACAEQTWLEAAVASFLPGTRQISLGEGITGPVARAALDAALSVDWTAIYPEKIPVELESQEWEKNLLLASMLLGREVPRWWPLAHVPEPAREHAARIVAEAGLLAGAFVACAAAGTANVQIKSWPAEHYGDTLAWLEREHVIRALLIGHASEREHLEAVRQRAREGGADPALWVGQDGEMPVLAGLLAAAKFFFGNDTGALHLAAALGRPVVPIFGGGNWLRFRPVARRSAVVVQPLPCFGCGWNCYFGYAPCVREIPDDAVRRALGWLLASDEDAETEIMVEDAIPSKGLDLIRETTATHRPHVGRHGDGDAPSQKALTDLFKQLDFSERDRAERLAAIETQGAEIARLHAEVDGQLKAAGEFWPKLDAAINERNLLTAQLEDLRGHFERNATDHAARLQIIENQGAEIARLHAEVDHWLREAGELGPKLEATENERNLLAAQLADLRQQFQGVEADHAARLQVIEDQGAEIARLHAEVDHWLREAGELGPKLEATENERNLLAAQLADLRQQFQGVEADHAARLQVIENQGTEIARLHAEVDRQLKAAGEFWPKLDTALNERNLLAAQMKDLRGHFENSEAEGASRLKLIESQGIEIARLHAEVDRWLREAGELRPQLEAVTHERNLRTAQLADLRGHFENSEADRAARLKVIESQGAVISDLQKQLAGNEGERERLSADLGSLHARHAAIEAERARLSADADEMRKAHAALAAEFEGLQTRQNTLEKQWTARLLKTVRLWPR